MATRAETVVHVDYNVGLGYLRAFATVLVIAHHSLIAYCAFAPPQVPFADPSGASWAMPVVDEHRWAGFDPFVASNDLYLMALMFFLSGLFVWSSLRRKGKRVFLGDRARRLGVPFVFAAALVTPLAYYPTYLATEATPRVGDYVEKWRSLAVVFGVWPAGPAWFIWVLLAFDCVAALVFAMAPRWDTAVHRGPLNGVLRSPAAFFGAIVAVTGLAYLPVVLAVGPDAWVTVGPFAFQTSRLLVYAAWFAAGIAAGAYGIERSFLASDGALARRWAAWLGVAAVLFGIAVVAIVTSIGAQSDVTARAIARGITFVLACASLNLTALAIALRFARTRVSALDSLRDNSYGMYLIHYAFVTWLQYGLLRAALPGMVKGVVVCAGAVTLSWATVAALRRVPAVGRII